MHELLESMVSDRGPQFAVELIKELNRILGIETKLSILFHPQIDRQTERMNQELKQYLWFFIDHRQKNWSKWLVIAEFTVNNKIYSTTKISLFMVNYSRELKMEADIRGKGKVEKITEFAKRMNKVQEEAEVALRKA